MLTRFVRLMALLFLVAISSDASAQDVRDLSKYLDNSVGRVIMANQAGQEFAGSGYAIAYGDDEDDIYFLTNQHVVREAVSVFVLYGIEEEMRVFQAEVIKESIGHDLALLALTQTDGDPFRPTVLALADYTIEQGDQVFAIGFPGFADQINERDVNDPAFIEPLLTQGIVGKRQIGTWIDQDFEVEILVHDASISGGNSGGPIVNRCGAVVGLNTETIGQSSLASSPKTIEAFLALTDVSATPSNGPCRGVVGGGFAMSAQQIALVAGFVLLALLAAATFFFRAQLFSAAGGQQRSGAMPPPIGGRQGSSQPVLYVTIDDKTVGLSAAKLRSGVTIGRSADSDVPVDSKKLSRNHAKMILIDRKLQIQDVGSTNGTKVGGVALAPRTPTQINTKTQITMGGLAVEISKSSR